MRSLGFRSLVLVLVPSKIQSGLGMSEWGLLLLWFSSASAPGLGGTSGEGGGAGGRDRRGRARGRGGDGFIRVRLVWYGGGGPVAPLPGPMSWSGV